MPCYYLERGHGSKFAWWATAKGVLLPKAILQQAGLEAVERVNLTVENGAIVLRAAEPAPRYQAVPA